MAKKKEKKSKKEKKDKTPKDKKKEKKKKSKKKEKKLSLEDDDLEVKLLDAYDEEAIIAGGGWPVGEVQRSFCRDFLAAGLFLLQLGFITIIAFKDGYPAIEAQNNNPKTANVYQGYLSAATIMAIISLMLGVAVIRLMLEFGGVLIKSLLFFALGVGAVLISTGSNNVFTAVIGIILVLVALVYGKMVWSRIPLANANLNTAIICLKANFGIFYLVFAYAMILFTYTLLWLASFAGANELATTCVKVGKNEQCETNKLFYIPYIIIYIWVYQVFYNCVNCLAAGVVSCWWTDPDGAHGCVSPATKVSFRRSLTTSFGSICWGALFTPYVQVINEVINPDGDMETGVTECFPQKCVDTFEWMVSYFSQWGFVYVGLYGYSFGDGSKRVNNMFRIRNWEPVISDHLLRNIFTLCIVCIAYIMGEIGKIVADSSDFFAGAKNAADFEAQLMGIIVGGVFGSLVVGAMTGAILAVIVLYAERPTDFEHNHPEAAEKMRAAYQKAYPNLFR